MATLIEAGNYRAKAISWAFGETSTRKPQIGVVFDVTVNDDEPGVKLTWYGFLHDEKSAKRTMYSMRACGWDGTGDVTDAQGLDKNEVEVVVEDNEYNGTVSSRIAWVNAIGPAVKTMGDDAKAQLNKRLAQWQKPTVSGGSQRATAPKAPPPAAKPAANNGEFPYAPAPVASDAGQGDDIPF